MQLQSVLGGRPCQVPVVLCGTIEPAFCIVWGLSCGGGPLFSSSPSWFAQLPASRARSRSVA